MKSFTIIYSVVCRGVDEIVHCAQRATEKTKIKCVPSKIYSVHDFALVPSSDYIRTRISYVEV